MSDVNQPGKPLYLGEDAERELLIERFEEAWQSGDPPNLAEFVAAAPHPNPGLTKMLNHNIWHN